MRNCAVIWLPHRARVPELPGHSALLDAGADQPQYRREKLIARKRPAILPPRGRLMASNEQHRGRRAQQCCSHPQHLDSLTRPLDS